MNLSNYPQTWPYAYGGPLGQGKIRCVAEDFVVVENLGFAADGAGEHVFLQIQKRGENTEYVAGQLAKFCGVAKRDIGYAGLKDRHALTTQWFSVWLPGKAEPDWTAFNSDSIQVLQAQRHSKKLRTGALSGNQFVIRVRDWQGDALALQQRLAALQAHGCPNYFGEQRFGRGGQNVAKAVAMFQGERVKREQRSIYLSAARSYLFNQILAERVRQGNWQQALNGDALMHDGSNSYFKCPEPDTEIVQRVASGQLHPTGSLCGQGDTDLSDTALALETQALAAYPELTEGLQHADVDSARRALRVNLQELTWEIDADSLLLRFALPPGSYATAVLRELVQLEDGP